MYMVSYGSTGFVPTNLPEPSRNTWMTPIVPPPVSVGGVGLGICPYSLATNAKSPSGVTATSKVPGAQSGHLSQFRIGYCGTWITPSMPHGTVKLVSRKNSAPCLSIAAPTLTCGEPGKNCIPSTCSTGDGGDGKLMTCWPPHGLVLKSDVLKTWTPVVKVVGGGVGVPGHGVISPVTETSTLAPSSVTSVSFGIPKVG